MNWLLLNVKTERAANPDGITWDRGKPFLAFLKTIRISATPPKTVRRLQSRKGKTCPLLSPASSSLCVWGPNHRSDPPIAWFKIPKFLWSSKEECKNVYILEPATLQLHSASSQSNRNVCFAERQHSTPSTLDLRLIWRDCSSTFIYDFPSLWRPTSVSHEARRRHLQRKQLSLLSPLSEVLTPSSRRTKRSLTLGTSYAKQQERKNLTARKIVPLRDEAKIRACHNELTIAFKD